MTTEDAIYISQSPMHHLKQYDPAKSRARDFKHKDHHLGLEQREQKFFISVSDKDD